jgi:hypothetical protein
MTASLLGKMTIPVSVCVLIISVNYQQTFAASFTVMTDKSYYLQGEPVVISGKIPPGNGREASMTIFADGVPVSNTNLLAENGSYHYRYIAGNPGVYFVEVSSGSLQNAAQAQFDVLSSYNIKIGGQNYNIGYELQPAPGGYIYYTKPDSESLPPPSLFWLNSITPDTKSSKLLVKLFNSGEGVFTIQLPRNVIQALTSIGPAGGSDSPYKVLVNGTDQSPDQVFTNEKTRILKIYLYNAGTQDIQIIGTWLAR